MDEKTVIARPKPAELADGAKPLLQDTKSESAKADLPNMESSLPDEIGGDTVVVRSGRLKQATSSGVEAAKVKPSTAKQKIAEVTQPKTTKKNAGTASVIALLALAVLLIGFGSALISIYIFSPAIQSASNEAPMDQGSEISDADLSKDIVAVETPESEAEDEALILAAIKPHVIELSGDPVIVRQLANAPRQLIKLEKPSQLQAASSLGVKSDVYRLKDLLDIPEIGLQSGVLGSQEDIAVVQSDRDNSVADDESVIVANGDTASSHISEYAQKVQVDEPLATLLKSIGMDPAYSQQAEASFAKLHNRQNVQKGDQIAVRAITSQDGGSRLIPMQMSIYSSDGYVGSVALNDIDAYADAADPWYGSDIFEAELLPVAVKDEDRPRLLDAIYAAAVRNRLPTPVVGEAIMMLSRAQDLEQKVEAGDTITIIYSPQARDMKTGLGRIVFISIGRTSGNLECYVLQAQQGAQFECAAAEAKGTIDQAATGAVGAIEQFVGRIIHVESADRCDARNPLSTAVGLGQFIESTWMVTIKIHRPDIYGKYSRRQILDMRTDCDLARAMTTAFTRDNAAVIRQSGHGVTPGNLYLAHFLGVGGALKVLSNDPNRQVADVFGASHVSANPFERGKSIGYLISWASKKMTGSSPPPSSDKSGTKVSATASASPNSTADEAKGMQANPPPQAPLTQYAANPQFAQLKSAVNLLLQP